MLMYLLFQRKPEMIVKKYLKDLGKNEELLFGEITNQYMNRCLKQLAFLADIENNLTFHMARHSGVYPDKNRGHPFAGHGVKL